MLRKANPNLSNLTQLKTLTMQFLSLIEGKNPNSNFSHAFSFSHPTFFPFWFKNTAELFSVVHFIDYFASLIFFFKFWMLSSTIYCFEPLSGDFCREFFPLLYLVGTFFLNFFKIKFASTFWGEISFLFIFELWEETPN